MSCQNSTGESLKKVGRGVAEKVGISSKGQEADGSAIWKGKAVGGINAKKSALQGKNEVQYWKRFGWAGCRVY